MGSLVCYHRPRSPELLIHTSSPPSLAFYAFRPPSRRRALSQSEVPHLSMSAGVAIGGLFNTYDGGHFLAAVGGQAHAAAQHLCRMVSGWPRRCRLLHAGRTAKGDTGSLNVTLWLRGSCKGRQGWCQSAIRSKR